MNAITKLVDGSKSYMVVFGFVGYIIVQAINKEALDQTVMGGFAAAYAAAMRHAVKKSTPAT